LNGMLATTGEEDCAKAAATASMTKRLRVAVTFNAWFFIGPPFRFYYWQRLKLTCCRCLWDGVSLKTERFAIICYLFGPDFASEDFEPLSVSSHKATVIPERRRHRTASVHLFESLELIGNGILGRYPGGF